jgi:hypothetical protein
MADVYFDTNGKYGEVIILDEYNGELSLVSGRREKDGDRVFKEWCYPQDKGRKPRDKSVPWKVRLGNQQTAVEFVGWLAAEFGLRLEQGGGQSDPSPDPGYVAEPDDSQIPF